MSIIDLEPTVSPVTLLAEKCKSDPAYLRFHDAFLGDFVRGE